MSVLHFLLTLLTIHSLCAVGFLLLVRFSSARVEERGMQLEPIPAPVEGPR